MHLVTLIYLLERHNQKSPVTPRGKASAEDYRLQRCPGKAREIFIKESLIPAV